MSLASVSLFGRRQAPSTGTHERDARFAYVALIAVWTVELWVAQSLSLHASHWHHPVTLVINQTFRFVLDALFCTVLVTAAPAIVLAPAFILSFFFYLLATIYVGQFHDAPSILRLMQTVSEGAAVTDFGLELLKPWHAAFVVTLAVKLGLLAQYRSSTSCIDAFRCRRRRRTVATVAVAWILIIGLAHVWRRPIQRVVEYETIGCQGMIYGYLPTWAAELALFDEEKVLERAIDATDEVPQTLAEREPPVDIPGHLVFLQVESLDSTVLGLEMNGVAVAPALTALRDESMFWLVQAPKQNGSCDADFCALTGQRYSPDLPNYKIPGFPYDGALPEQLASAGWSTEAIHGVTGSFFQRRAAYEAMGFTDLFFREELESLVDATPGAWGYTDSDVLRFSAERLRAADRPTFQIVITVTSHGPFHFVPEGAPLVFPRPEGLLENYINSMHYVDEVIGEYVASLPEGTTVVIYGDHSSKIDTEHYAHVEVDGVGIVPAYIYRVGDDLSDAQATRDLTLATSGELELLDLLGYVHASVDASLD